MSNPSQPVWVSLPGGNTQLDVAPLLNILSILDATPSAAPTDGLRDVIQRAIRTLNLSQHDPEFIQPVDLINLYADLYKLYDVIEAMNSRFSPSE